MKKGHTFLKRCLSILLSVSMIVGLIVVTEPEKAADVQAAESTNLITNGGFETGDMTSYDSNTNAAISSEKNYAGNYAAKVAYVSETTRIQKTVSGLTSTNDQIYKLSAMIYLDDSATESTVQFNFNGGWNADWSVTNVTSAWQLVPNLEKGKWVQFEYYIDALADTEHIQFQFYTERTGTDFYVDEITLTAWDGDFELNFSSVDSNGHWWLSNSALPNEYLGTDGTIIYRGDVYLDNVLRKVHITFDSSVGIRSWDFYVSDMTANCAAPSTSLRIPEGTVLTGVSEGDGDKTLKLSNTLYVTKSGDSWTQEEWTTELTLSFSQIDGGNHWMFNRSSVLQYLLDGRYYQFDAYVDGSLKSLWLEFSGNETYIYAGVIGTPAESLRIPAGTVLYEFDAANTGAKVEGGRQMILASTLYVEKSEDTWQEVTWVPKVTFGFEKIDGGNWWITREVATDFDNTWYQAQVMVDGNEQTAWIEFISGYAYIYGNCFGGDAPTTSFLIEEGTILYESVALGDKVANGKELTLSEQFYVVCTDGTWEESVFSSVADNTPYATNMPSGKENMISGGDFTTNSETTFTTVQNVTFENGYAKLQKPNGEDGSTRAYLGTPALTYVAGHSYTISYYIYITEATGLTFDMQYVSHKNTSGFNANSAWGTDFVFANYSHGTNVSYKYNNETVTPASMSNTTEGWKKVELTWTAKQNDTADIRLMGYYGAGTIYVDDLVVYDNTVKTTTDITITQAYPDTANSWYMVADDITKATSSYYKMTMKVDGKEATVPVGIKYGKFVIWNDFFPIIDGTEIPSESFVIPKDTILYPIDPNNTGWTTEIDGNRLNVTEDVEVYAIGSGWGTYSEEHDTSATPIYYCIDNNMSYMVTSSAGAYEIVKDGNTEITTTTLMEEGTYDITRIEQDTKFVQKVVLYKSGDAHVDEKDSITAADLVAVKRAVLAENDNTLGEQFAADLNQSGTVDGFDANAMRKALVSDTPTTYLAKVKGNTSLNGEMPIIGFDGPDEEFLAQDGVEVERVYDMIADLGINTVLLNREEVGTNYTFSKKHLTLAENKNLKLYLHDGYVADETNIHGIASVGENDRTAKLSGITAKYDGYSSFGGYYIYDEPMYNAEYDGQKYIEQFDVPLKAVNNYTNIHSYMSLFPYIAGQVNAQLGGPPKSAMSYANYAKYVNQAANAGAEALSYDLYLRGNGVTTDSWFWETTTYKIHTEDFWTNLDWMRSIATDKPFYAFVQVGNDFNEKNTGVTKIDNLTTIQEMYFEANAALAMGAKGINYYSLIQPSKYVTSTDGTKDYTRSGLINYKGEANNGGSHGANYTYYDAAKKINAYIKAVDEVLMNATSTAVVTTNSTVASYLENAVSRYGSIASINNKEVLVGCFDYYGQEAFMVVNITPDAGDKGSSQTVTLTFDGAQSGKYIEQSEKDIEQSEKDIDMNYTAWQTLSNANKLSLEIPAGEAVVIVLD